MAIRLCGLQILLCVLPLLAHGFMQSSSVDIVPAIIVAAQCPALEQLRARIEPLAAECGRDPQGCRGSCLTALGQGNTGQACDSFCQFFAFRDQEPGCETISACLSQSENSRTVPPASPAQSSGDNGGQGGGGGGAAGGVDVQKDAPSQTGASPTAVTSDGIPSFSTPANPNQASSESSSGMSIGSIIGIVVGAVAFAAIVVAAAFFLVKKKKNNSLSEELKGKRDVYYTTQEGSSPDGGPMAPYTLAQPRNSSSRDETVSTSVDQVAIRVSTDAGSGHGRLLAMTGNSKHSSAAGISSPASNCSTRSDGANNRIVQSFATVSRGGRNDSTDIPSSGLGIPPPVRVTSPAVPPALPAFMPRDNIGDSVASTSKELEGDPSSLYQPFILTAANSPTGSVNSPSLSGVGKCPHCEAPLFFHSAICESCGMRIDQTLPGQSRPQHQHRKSLTHSTPEKKSRSMEVPLDLL